MSRAIKTTLWAALWAGLSLCCVIAVAVILLLNFDWNRAKPWIEERVSEAVGREFSILGELSLSWHAAEYEGKDGKGDSSSWIPWPHLIAHRVRLGNPDWAAEPHMAEMARLAFSVKPLALLSRRIVIPLLSVDTPTLTLERLQDGRNNWKFDRQQDSGWRVELRKLAFNGGAVRVIDRVRHADLKIDLDNLDEDIYRVAWKASGRFNGETVSGKGRAGGVLSLRDADTRFPVDASITVGSTSIKARGFLTGPRALKAVDLQLKVAGVSMAQLYPLIGVLLPETRPFVTEGRLTGKPGPRGGNWTYQNFRGKSGDSELSGTLHYRWRDTRPLVEGSVVASHLSLRDLAPLIGADSRKSKLARGSRALQPKGRIFPVEQFKTTRWTSVDANVRLSSRNVTSDFDLPINDVSAHIRLKNGVLSLSPLTFRMAGGELKSIVRLDGNSEPVKADIQLSARHLKLQELFPALTKMSTGLGEINGDATLRGSGNSIAALLASSSGELRTVINKGTFSKLMLEQLGLNIGSIIATSLFGDEQVALNCAVSDFDVRDGVMQARAFVVDTDDAVIYVNGNIDLAREQLALVLQPDTKGLRLFSLRSPVHVTGALAEPKVSVDKGSVAMKAGSAIALGALAPAVMALIPLVNLGPEETNECAKLLEQAGLDKR